MARMTSLQLAAVCLFSITIPSVIAFSIAQEEAQAIGLLPRANTCSVAGYTPCNHDGLPDSFCCPSTSTCIPFNNKKSAICCPTGETCSIITAISCDVSQQNATLHPESQLFSTDLSGTLQTCNGKCCPNGYHCDKSGQCSISTFSTPSSTSSTSATSSSSTSQKPTSSTSSASATTSSASNSASATATPPSSATTNSAAPHAHCPQFTPAATLVGFFSGLAAGIILTIAFLCCFGHRRHKEEPSSPHSSDFSNVRASISDPIYKSEGMDAVRADFLRRDSKPRRSLRSMFSRSSTLGARNAPVDGIGRSIVKAPQTPINQRSPSMRREPSMESIRIYSPPGGGLGRPGTQLGDMLNEVGWDPTKPYLGSPGRVDPRSRGIGSG